MMKKAALVLALLAGLAVLVVPALLAMVAVLFNASAQASRNPCTSPVVSPAGGPVRVPATGAYTVTSEYGMRYNPGSYGNGVYKLHGGIDLSMRAGSRTVVAASAGVVSAMPVEPGGGGNIVVVDHGGGVSSTYMHLASRSVRVGEKVWAGKGLGVEGSTGNSTGPHLHFTIKVGGQPVDPRPWLVGRGVVLPPTGGSATAPAEVALAPAGSTPAVSSPSPATAGGPTAQPVVSSLPAQVGPYKGAQVTNAGYIIRAGQAMRLDAKTITIGVMTAMGESSLVNIAHGDAAEPDSRGLFQQRATVWGTLADRMNPTIAATSFFKALVAVPGYHDLEPTIAAHKAQRNADPFHYTPYWADAVLMVSTLTSDPSLPASLPASGYLEGCADGGPSQPSGSGDGSSAAIMVAAQHYKGTPYSWGGGDQQGPSLGIYTSRSLDGSHTVGFDCSGLVMFAVHNATGLQLAHSAEARAPIPAGRSSLGTGQPCNPATSPPSARTAPAHQAATATSGSASGTAR